MATVWYKVHKDHNTHLHSLDFPSSERLGLARHRELIAMQCAEDYYKRMEKLGDNLNGWPLVFTLHETNDGPELARLKINCKPVPHFHISEGNG